MSTAAPGPGGPPDPGAGAAPGTANAAWLDTLPCPWLRLDARGTVQAANAALGTLLGAPPAHWVGRPFDSLLTRASRVLYQSYLQPLLRLHGRVEEFSVALDAGPGAPVDVLVYSQPLPASPQAAHAPEPGPDVALLLAPIRQRRRIEDEMLRIKRAADLAPGIIFQLMALADGSFHFPYASEAIRQLYGVTPEQACQSADCVLALIDADDRPGVLAGLRDAARQGLDWRGVYRVHRPGLGLRWHEVQAAPRRLAHGVTLWHGHVDDVTQRRVMEQALADKLAMEQVHRARSEFLARVSHELRTPLNAILGFADLLATDSADNLLAVQQQRLGLIRSSGRHLLALVEEVLEVSSIESGQVTVVLQPLALLPQLQRVWAVMASAAQQAGVSLLPLDTSAPSPDSAAPAPALCAMAHETRLHQVLVNLVSNAIKYNRPGGTVRLQVRPDAVAGRVVVRVQDTGIGLSPAQQASLFQPFNRLGAEHGPVAGNGLGLVIARQLLGLMGGQLAVHSQPGQGSTFSLSLALPAGAVVAAAALSSAAGRSPAPPGPPPLPQAQGRVLYVEDNEVNALLMQAIVGLRPGLQLRLAVDGASALAEAAHQPPDLLLIDMHLPDANGIELLLALRALPGLQAVPAVVVSAGARADDIARAQCNGFQGYWTKPLDIDRTLRELDGLLGAARG